MNLTYENWIRFECKQASDVDLETTWITIQDIEQAE